MKSPTTIRRHKKRLRAECIDNVRDPILRRVAYAMETAVTWATTDTVGWPSLAEEARALAEILRKELAVELANAAVIQGKKLV